MRRNIGLDSRIDVTEQVISQSVNCTESVDSRSCLGKSDAASNIPEGVTRPCWGMPRSFINGY